LDTIDNCNAYCLWPPLRRSRQVLGREWRSALAAMGRVRLPAKLLTPAYVGAPHSRAQLCQRGWVLRGKDADCAAVRALVKGFHWWESGRRVRLSLLNLFQPGFDWPWWFAECGPLQPPESIRLEKRFQLLGGRARLARLLAHSFLRTVALAVVRHEPLDKTSSTQRSVEELPGC
jgi:hypothetical protein